MAPTRRNTRASSATTTTTTPVINVQLKALIDQGVANALVARDADRSQNGDDNHNSRMDSRRTDEILDSLVNLGLGIGSHSGTSFIAIPMCERMFPEKSDNIEKYVGGLPDMIHGSVMASKPKTMQDAVEFATKLMVKKISTFAERQTENKRKQDDNQQQQNKRQNIGKAYTAGPRENKPYGGSKPLHSKFNYHHDGLCAPKCHKCNKVGHLAHDCRSPAATNNKI
uniref:CCHC-type domain-containing protein n=1 Tax=Tanacetum cinerariifolium TaxID=118510 RepID=A0A6L2JEW3_TANCI|nr:hypothetical protein [Tanacetum cinerariifolium]